MSPTPKDQPTCSLRFPRVSGDEPLIDLINHDQEAFSPRERG